MVRPRVGQNVRFGNDRPRRERPARPIAAVPPPVLGLRKQIDAKRVRGPRLGKAATGTQPADHRQNQRFNSHVAYARTNSARAIARRRYLICPSKANLDLWMSINGPNS